MSLKKHKHIFVLDTSVLAYDYNAISSFENCEVVLPITVVDELDKLKKTPSEVGRNVRTVIRNLDKLIEGHDVSIGIPLPNNVIFKIDSSYEGSHDSALYGDIRILHCANKLQSANKSKKVVLVSRDINLRIRAKSFGLEAQHYEREELTSTELFQGFRTISDAPLGQFLLDQQKIPCDTDELKEMHPNEFVLFTDKYGTGISSGRKINNELQLVTDKNPWGLHMRGKEQLFASNLMLDPNVPLVSVIGKSGNGKSLLSLACGLESVLNQRKYSRFIIYRPIQVMGNELGYLPGDLQSKLDPYFAAISDSMQFLFSGKSRKSDSWKEQLYQYMDSGIIQQEALTYIRGRSISNAFILVDEAQNLSASEMKAILTRAGEGSKIVLNGDIEQIDNPKLDPINNGLTYVIDKFKRYDLAGHITLTKGERSPLATLASNIL